MNKAGLSKKHGYIPAALWLIIVGVSFIWNISVLNDYYIDIGRQEGSSFFKHIVNVRLWNATVGSVYVPISKSVLPNPYLEDKDRDVVTTTGLRLTKINPAYMTRQLAEISNKKDHVQFKITSLSPIRAANAADKWERDALMRFEKGETEYYSYVNVNGKTVFKYMAPLYVESLCLKCHEKQGYSIGDVRGGISITLPTGVLEITKNIQQKNLIILHISILIVGFLGIYMYQRRIYSQWLALRKSKEELQRANDELEARVDERTTALKNTNAKLIDEIEERRRVQEQLWKLSLAVEQCPASIVITDLKGHIEYVNPRFSESSGYLQDETMGRDICCVVTCETNNAFKLELNECIKTGSSWHGELQNFSKDGTPYWEHANVSPIKDPTGRITHYLYIGENLTEYKKLQEQLRHSQKIEAVGRLAGGIAHDFNNIISAIMNYCYILQNKLIGNEQLNGYTNKMLVLSEKAARLTWSLLVFSGKQKVNKLPININFIIRSAWSALTVVFPSSVEVKDMLSKEDIFVSADSKQFEQVLYNIATNARDAMPNGGTFTISTYTTTLNMDFKANGIKQPGYYAVIALADTGIGMEVEVLERIFEPFFTTKEMDKGTGLGLSTVHGIIEQHDGYITVESEVKKGTVFKIYLPKID